MNEDSMHLATIKKVEFTLQMGPDSQQKEVYVRIDLTGVYFNTYNAVPDGSFWMLHSELRCISDVSKLIRDNRND